MKDPNENSNVPPPKKIKTTDSDAKKEVDPKHAANIKKLRERLATAREEFLKSAKQLNDRVDRLSSGDTPAALTENLLLGNIQILETAKEYVEAKSYELSSALDVKRKHNATAIPSSKKQGMDTWFVTSGGTKGYREVKTFNSKTPKNLIDTIKKVISQVSQRKVGKGELREGQVVVYNRASLPTKFAAAFDKAKKADDLSIFTDAVNKYFKKDMATHSSHKSGGIPEQKFILRLPDPTNDHGVINFRFDISAGKEGKIKFTSKKTSPYSSPSTSPSSSPKPKRRSSLLPAFSAKTASEELTKAAKSEKSLAAVAEVTVPDSTSSKRKVNQNNDASKKKKVDSKKP